MFPANVAVKKGLFAHSAAPMEAATRPLPGPAIAPHERPVKTRDFAPAQLPCRLPALTSREHGARGVEHHLGVLTRSVS